MPKTKALISDADGTLIDTVRLIRHGQYEAAKLYLTNHGISEGEIPDYKTYVSLLNQVVGGSTRNTTEATLRLLYEASPQHLVGIDFDELYSTLGPIQDRIAPEYVKPYEGLQTFLRTLSEKGIRLAIFSSGSAHHIVRNFSIALPELSLSGLHTDRTISDHVKLHLLEQRFTEVFALPDFTIVTAEDSTKHKPDPAGLLIALSRLGVEPAEAAVLGDHKVDMQAATSARVSLAIGITHGFDDEKTLTDHGASAIVHSLHGTLSHLS